MRIIYYGVEPTAALFANMPCSGCSTNLPWIPWKKAFRIQVWIIITSSRCLKKTSILWSFRCFLQALDENVDSKRDIRSRFLDSGHPLSKQILITWLKACKAVSSSSQWFHLPSSRWQNWQRKWGLNGVFLTCQCSQNIVFASTSFMTFFSGISQ